MPKLHLVSSIFLSFSVGLPFASAQSDHFLYAPQPSAYQTRVFRPISPRQASARTESSRLEVPVSLSVPSRPKSPEIEPEISWLLDEGIAAQRQAGHRYYNPKYAYIVDPSKQQMMVVDVASRDRVVTMPVGTGKNGIGFGSAQTPTGFFTMGGVRIAKDASAYIQTGDSKTGVSGLYAEILYPPSHADSRKRGRVPNNVIIHGFNPRVSSMLKERHEKRLIGKKPCTTGCPVPRMEDLPKLIPYLKESAGKFDPTANPNSNLRKLIRKKQVVEYSNSKRLGDPIVILKRSHPSMIN